VSPPDCSELPRGRWDKPGIAHAQPEIWLTIAMNCCLQVWLISATMTCGDNQFTLIVATQATANFVDDFYADESVASSRERDWCKRVIARTAVDRSRCTIR